MTSWLYKIPALLLASMVAASAASIVPETKETFPVDKIKPGMKAVTYTVLKGTTIEPVETTILGVEKNGLGPGLDMIIGRLDDHKTVLTNAVHGMSGSPMFIEDPADGKMKIAGALSRRIAMFEKDGHCGFTPIDDMLDVAKHMTKAPEDNTLGTEFASVGKARPNALSSGNSSFRPLAVPLTISGADPEFWNSMAAEMKLPKDLFLTTPGGGTNANLKLDASDLVPGAPVAAVLMTGDVGIAGTGTLTWRQGEKVLGFGHPMFGFGSSHLPMATAEIITTVPSYARPFKMANTGKIVGTVSQDRWSAIGGFVGPKPKMSQYHLKRTHEDQPRPDIQGEFYPHELLTPMLLAMAFQGTLLTNDDMSRTMEIRVRGELKFKDLPSLKLNRFYAGQDFDIQLSVRDFIAPIMTIFSQRDEKVVAEDFSLEIETNERPTQFTIERISTDRRTYEPGDKVQLYVEMKKVYGERFLRTVEFQLPENLRSGDITIRAGSAAALDQSRVYRLLSNAENVSEMIEAFNQRRLDDRVYVQVATDTAGLVVNDEELPALPDSVIQLLQGANASEQHPRLNEKIWIEEELELDGLVLGRESINITIE